ncbi:MAG: hypothetical protein JW797_01095 [Bradymonadales bacterium]|nr:hypothetical protein [Bradymonadales bacterium]
MTSLIAHLLGAKGRGLANSLTRGHTRAGIRIFLLVLLGAGFWAFLFAASYWFVDQCQRVELFGDLLVERLVSTAILILFAILFFSNLVSSFSTYFLSEDLQLLVGKPLPPYSLFTARFLELLLQSSWMASLFSLPVFLAVGLVYHAHTTFYLRLAALLLPLPVIATALATMVSLVLTNTLPARRTRELLALLVALLFVIVFVVFRSLEPERFLNPDERESIVQLLSTFHAPELAVLPSTWVHRALWPSLSGEVRPFFPYLFSLYTTASALFVLSGWLFRGLHFGGFSKSAEGRHEGSAPERLFRLLAGRRPDPASRGRAVIEALSRQPATLRFAREMWRKDLRTFVRDTAQWTQMILLVALVFIYLLNFQYIRPMGQGGFIGPLGLYFANLGLASFVITAISVRFVFPMVSLEGRSFWMIRTAPLTTLDFLRSKWWTSAVVICLFGQGLILASNLLIGTGRSLSIAALVFQTPASVGVVGLGVGLGAMYPRFHVDNAARIATGFGGFFYMVTGVLLNLVILLLSAPATVLAARLAAGHRVAQISVEHLILAVTLAILALAVGPLMAAGVIRLGAKRLDRAL